MCYNKLAMQVSSVKSNRILTPKTTGYTATAGLVWSIYSGVSKNRAIKKTHKPAAYISAALTALHIGLIEYNHYKWKRGCGKTPKLTDFGGFSNPT